jgi:hypothetical protein
MLKIKDAAGKLVGILEDTDSEPTMNLETNLEEIVDNTLEGENNVDTDDVNV